MTKYVKFLKNKQKEFMKEIKLKYKNSWDNLAYLLKINRSMIFIYLNEKCKIPYERYKFLCNKFNIKENKYKVKLLSIKYKGQNINLPNLSPSLAEFLGILAGDGHLTKINYEISVCGNKILDKKYFNLHLNKLFKQLFNIKPQVFIHKNINYIKYKIHSKQLLFYLSNTFGLPIGKKKNKLNIPNQIYNSPYSKDYIRGLFDTDGSFHRHHKKTAAIEIVSADKNFLKQIFNSFKYLNFSPCRSNKSVYLYQKKEIEKFFKEIKPANNKHLFKYKIYQQKGYVPLTINVRG